ncbi:unnamed protein product, partial [Porites lobata]
MPRTFPRICPLCGKPGVSNLSSHLEIVHDLTGLRRTRLLKEAKVSWESKREYISTSVDLPRCSSSSTRKICEPRKRRRPANETPKTSSTAKKFSLLVVGPSQSGKTVFVEQILTRDRIVYETNKPRRIL